MRWFVAESKFKVYLFLLILFSAFFRVSFCDDARAEAEHSFDESTPIDISSSSKMQGGGEAKDKDSRVSLPNIYDSGKSDEFLLETASQELSYTTHVFRLVLSLLFVLGLAYIALRLMRRGRLFSVNDDPYIKLVANLNIEQGKSIKVVTIGDKAYVISVAGSSINKIAELDDKALVDAMKLKATGDEEQDGVPFTKIFSNFFPIKSRRGNGQAESFSGETSFDDSFNDSFLRSQQERLKNINFRDSGSQGGGE